MNVVRPFIKLSRAFMTVRSVPTSSALVGSSRIRIGAFFKNARAIAMRCLSPPDSCIPRSPAIVS
jgi:hypothetical protein